MQNSICSSIYLDFNATTPVDPRVFEAMTPYFNFQFGNPASQLHAKGWEAKSAVENARSQVAELIGAQASEICFTMGSTESNNWALKGLIDSIQDQEPGRPIHVLTSNIEHASVREPLLYLQRTGRIELDLVPVDPEGFVSLETLQKYRKPHTRLLSLIWVHNEIGTIQNMAAVSQWAHENGLYFHTDATQAVGKIKVDVKELPISLLSFSGHKIYGPKGVGCLYVRAQNPKVALSPLLHGGGQETHGRSGTLNVPGIVGLGVACELAMKEMQADWQKASKLTQNFWSRLKSEFPEIKLNGPQRKTFDSVPGSSLSENRSAYNLNITFPRLQGSDLLPLLPELCVSGGSACRSGNLQGNPVLIAIGHDPLDPSVSLRISVGRSTTESEMNEAYDKIRKALKSLNYFNQAEGSQRPVPVLE